MSKTSTIAEYLDLVGYEAGDLITICWKTQQGRSLSFAHRHVADAPAFITDLPDTDIWISGGTLRHVPESGRGTEDDMGRIPALWADFDIKPGSFASQEQIQEVIDELSAMLGVRPAAMVASGGGLQPRWVIEGDLDKATLERFGRLVKKVCEAHGYHADPVYDLARILRCPTTWNHKYDPPRQTGTFLLDGAPLSLEALDDVLDAYGVPAASVAPVQTEPLEPLEPGRGNNYASKAVEGVLADLRDAASWPVGHTDERGRGWEKLTADCARRLLSLASADWNDLTADRIQPMFIDAVPLDASWTIKDALGKWESESRKAVPAAPPRDLLAGVMFDPKARPEGEDAVTLPNNELDVSNPLESVDFLRDNVGIGRLSGFFVRGNELVRTPLIGEDGYITPDPGQSDGLAQIRSVTSRGLAAHLSCTYRPYFVKVTGKGDAKQVMKVDTLYPLDVAQTIVEALDSCRAVRSMKGVTHTPLVRPDGSILTTPGYDSATRLLYLPDPELKVEEVSDVPDAEEIERAKNLLTGIVADFPFVLDSDRMNYLGLLITPVLRGLCPPPYKLGAMTAPSPGSGKTLLADILRTVHGGVFRSEMPADDTELKKSISAILDVTTSPVVHFDNLSGVLKSSALAGLLTSDVWSDRRLGSSTNVDSPNDRLWVITGNNLAIGGDLPRRTITVTIDPKMPNPHLRSGYAIDPLLPYVQEHRGELLWAMLTLVRHWHVSGRPVRGKRSSDGFGTWIESVDGILSHAGIAGVFDSQETQIEAGAGDDEWGEFLAAVHEEFGGNAWLAKEVLAKVRTYGLASHPNGFDPKPIDRDKLPGELLTKLGQSDVMSLSKSLGWWLKNHAGRYASYDGAQYTARAAGDTKNGKKWSIEKV